MAVHRISKWHLPYGRIPLLSLTEKILPFAAAALIAFAVAWLLSASLGWFFASRNYGPAGEGMIGSGNYKGALQSHAMNRPSIADFVESNPFNVLLGQAAEVGTEEGKNDLFSLDGMTLSGTIPGIGAQLNDGDRVPFILEGGDYRGYTLKKVDNDKAVFIKGKKEYSIYLLYSMVNRTSSSRKGRSVPPAKVSENADGPREIPARGVIHNGTIARELVNDLLMNPFDELKKVRLRPKFRDGNPLGIEVQWIAKGSLLRELGVEKGDIVQSINGVSIKNMGDISNAINSMMGGDRFEVEVMRKGKEVPLTYAVK